MEPSPQPVIGQRWSRFAGVIEQARRRARRRRLALLALCVLAACAGWFTSRSLGGSGVLSPPAPMAEGLLPPAKIGPGQGWYVRAIGTINVHTLHAFRPEPMVFESLELASGWVLTRWTVPGQGVRQISATSSGLKGLRLPLPTDPRPLLKRIHQTPALRSPERTFASLLDILTGPTPIAVHRAALRSLLLVPGVHTKMARDWRGRRGRVYILGEQSITILPETGAVLALSNMALHASFLQGRLVPKCVVPQRSRTEFTLPKATPDSCFLSVTPPS